MTNEGNQKGNAPTINITSHNQMGGVTAHTVHMGSSQRHIDDSLRRQILSDLPRENPINVTAIWGDTEAIILAEEILAFLKANKFLTTDGISQAMFNQLPKGLHVRPSKDGKTTQFIVGANERR